MPARGTFGSAGRAGLSRLPSDIDAIWIEPGKPSLEDRRNNDSFDDLTDHRSTFVDA